MVGGPPFPASPEYSRGRLILPISLTLWGISIGAEVLAFQGSTAPGTKVCMLGSDWSVESFVGSNGTACEPSTVGSSSLWSIWPDPACNIGVKTSKHVRANTLRCLMFHLDDVRIKWPPAFPSG